MMMRPAGMSSDEDSDYEGFVVQSPTNGPKKPKTFQTELPRGDKFVDAAKNLDLNKMKELLAEGVDINYKPKNNWNAIIHVANIGDLSILKWLVENGADVNSSHERVTPLLALCDSASQDELQLYECLEYLLAVGANPHDRDWFKVPAISKAVKRNHKNLVIKLLHEGCDINCADTDGWTPIFYAVDTCNKELIDFLKDSGASLYSIDSRGRSLIEFAATKDNKDIVEMLADGKYIQDDDSCKPMTFRSSFEDMVAQLPNPKDRLSGFPCEVHNILTTIGLQCLSHDFQKRDIDFGKFLMLTDEELKDIGVRFWFDRVRILYATKQFLESPWDITGFGMNITDTSIDVFKVTETLATILRMLTILNYTMYKSLDGDELKDMGTIKMMLRSCRDISRILQLIRKHAVVLDLTIKTVSCDLLITEKPVSKWKVVSKEIFKVGLSCGLALVPAFIMWKRLKH